MPGSTTTPGQADTRDDASARVAFRVVERVGTQGIPSFAARWLACAHPSRARAIARRFAITLADADPRLGADAVHYSFIVADFDRLLLASLLAHRQPGSKA
jgi:hypothetical protein